MYYEYMFITLKDIFYIIYTIYVINIQYMFVYGK